MKPQQNQKTQPENDNGSEVKAPWYKTGTAKTIFYCAISLLGAVVLWGYALFSENPMRTKEFSDVSLSYVSGSEADLALRNLMVYENAADVLRDVTVTVSAPLTDITRISSDDISATIDLNSVHGAGQYQLALSASTPLGDIVSIEPATVTITVDNMVSKTYIVSCETVGSLPDGYWNSTPTMLSASCTLTGANKKIEQIKNVKCLVDLSDLTTSLVNTWCDLTLYDASGNVVDDMTAITGTIPEVCVNMTVYPYADVPVEVKYANELDKYLTVYADLSVSTVRIACDQASLDKLKFVYTTPIDLSTFTQAGSYEYAVELQDLPSGARVLNGGDMDDIIVFLTVEDKQSTVTFENVRIYAINASQSLDYDFAFIGGDEETELPLFEEGMTVTISGPTRYVEAITAEDIYLTVNVADLMSGTSAEVPVNWSIAGQDIFTASFSVTLQFGMVRIDIRPSR